MKPEIHFRALNREDDYRVFTAQTNYHPTSQFGGIVAYMIKDGQEIGMGMVGLDSWTVTSVMVHWYIRHPRCIMPLWEELLAYLQKHGKRKLIGSTPGDNSRALNMIFNKLGWQEVARVKDGWDEGIDIVISEYIIHGANRESTASVRSAA